jgi:hypothetical protein
VISKKIFGGLLMLILMLVMIPGCATPELNIIELVPENANLLASIQVGQMVNDQALRGAYEGIEKDPDMPPKVEEALDEVLEKTGIDLREVSQAVVFADITDMEAMDVEEYLGILVEGNFDEELIINKIEENGEMDFTVSDYNDYKIYIDQEEGFTITFLSEKILLAGSKQAVYDAIDVNNGDKKKVSGILLDTFNRFGDVMIKLAIGIPEGERKAMAEEPATGEIPISFEAFSDMETVGFALSKSIDTVTIQLDCHFSNAESATNARDTIDGAITLFKGMSPDAQVNPLLKPLLSKIEVGIEGSWVTIELSMNLAEIEGMAETFQTTETP